MHHIHKLPEQNSFSLGDASRFLTARHSSPYKPIVATVDAECKGTIPPQKTCSHGENRHALISMSNVFFWFVVDRKAANTFAILMILLVYVDTGW